MQNKHALYMFLDESGDLNFSKTGSNYFILSSLSAFRPFPWYQDLIDLKFKYLESPHHLNLQRFHASEDRQEIRDGVFEILNKHHASFRLDSIIVQKNKAHPKVRELDRFYPMILRYLLTYVVKGYQHKQISEAIFVTDTLPVKKGRNAIDKGIKTHLKDAFPSNLMHQIHHWDSKSTIGLQAVDYLNWAIYKKWNNGEMRPYNQIKNSVHSEFDIFKKGTTEYY
ncbi:MAG: DUF3800 domain-containing protein [Bdellovibrionaceae bacterium]|nr:DUF3800 domain-containing protein [Pseudobdellovibrionaceae bacterium]